MQQFPPPPPPTQPSTVPTSHKDRRKARKSKSRSASPSLTPSTPPPSHTPLSTTLRPPPSQMPLHRPLFIASLGNPSPTYANTLHSAGHFILQEMRTLLSYPPFAKDRLLANGLVTRGTLGTLWMSPSLMNDSGRGVRAAWTQWCRDLGVNHHHHLGDGAAGGGEDKGAPLLVIVHDELEAPLGKVTVKRGANLSAKGHNGLKSVMACLPGQSFVRVGVGIGRPVSRESGEVAEWVLRKMTGREREGLEGAAGEVVNRLWDVRGGG